MPEPLVILGAGLAGLSAAYHAHKAGKPYLLFEKEARAGGLVRSERVHGFNFDYTGHLLHLSRQRTRSLVLDELGLRPALAPMRRDSWVYSGGRYTRAPFQAHLFGLPPDAVRECLEGALRAHGALPPAARGPSTVRRRARVRSRGPVAGFENFEDFNLRTLGEGIYRRFMEPYNTKLWGLHPSRMSTEFMQRFLPRPSLAQIFEGALFDVDVPQGYNADFLYPKRVGIEVLARAFAARVSVRTGARALAVDPKRKQVRFEGGVTQSYARLVTTLPLPRLVGLIRGAPPRIRRAAARLRAASVFNVNLGVAGRDVCAKQWIYVPGAELPFYRVGFYHHFSKGMAPKGASGIYAEISYGEGRPLDKAAAPARVKEGLRAMGILRASDAIAAQWSADIRDAYVLYDVHRRASVGEIQAWLREQGIVSTGRWGRWEYAAMEDAIWQGAEAVD